MQQRNPLLVATVTAALLTLLPFQLGGSAEPSRTIPQADALIKECWARTEAMRSMPSMGAIRQGLWLTVKCLKEIVLDQSQILFPEGDPSRAEVNERLDDAINGSGKMYWDIYNGHHGCFRENRPGCGTIFHSFHLPPIARVLEDMIRSMMWVRVEYKL